jgi:hypothetical protein
MSGTSRQRAVGKALSALLPMAPYADTEPIREAARFFVVDEINAVLTRWRATRLLEPDGEEE